MTIQLRQDDFKRFAPRAKQGYVDALFANIDKLRAAGILETKERWCHFIGQAAAETDGFTILRESLTYTTVRRIREVWRARAAKCSDDWIAANLIRNPIALGDWAYGGRMGNAKGTNDGFAYRGGGWIQTTGKEAVAEYCKKIGEPLRDDVLDDLALTLRFAIAEWTDGKCNEYADRDDVVGISKIINTGSAKSGVQPNGMERRRAEVTKALRIWGDVADVEPEPVRMYPEVVPVSPTKAAVSSASIRTLVLGGVEYTTGAFSKGLEKALALIPEVGTDVESLMAPIKTLSSVTKINIAGIGTAIVIACIVRAIIRHAKLKAENNTIKGE